MKILFVVNSYYPHVNGVYTFIRTVASELKKQGHQVAVLAPSESHSSSKTKIDGIDVFGVASYSILFYRAIRLPIPFIMQSRIERILQEFKPDVIHIQDHFVLTKATVQVNKKYKIPLLATNHFMTENFTAFFKSAGIRKVLDRWMWSDFSKVFNDVAVVTTPTETAAKLIRPLLRGKVIAISNGIDLTKFSPGNASKKFREKYALPDVPMLLYVGRLDPEKHIEEILQAIALDGDKTNFCFVVVGKGIRMQALELLTEKLRIQHRVVFTGYIPEEDLQLFYQASQCFVTASIAELQSIATMEAMASGLPVIAVKAGALAELVHDNENGFLFLPGDTAKLLQSIVSIFSSDEVHRRMKAASLNFIQAHSLEKTISSYEVLYDACLRPSA